MRLYSGTRVTLCETGYLGRTVDSREMAKLQSTLLHGGNKGLPRESTVPPRSGFVGTFLLAGCLTACFVVNLRVLKKLFTSEMPKFRFKRFPEFRQILNKGLRLPYESPKPRTLGDPACQTRAKPVRVVLTCNWLAVYLDTAALLLNQIALV